MASSKHSEEVAIPLDDGHGMRARLIRPQRDNGLKAGVIVLHDVFGFTDDVLRIGQRLADAGYTALVPDLYDQPGSHKPLCVARTLAAHVRGQGRPFEVIETTRKWFLRRKGIDKVAMMGFCMGGRFALLAAVRSPIDVVAPFYGSVPRRAGDLQGICPVVGGWGRRDKLDGRDGDRLKNHLERLQVEHDIVTYDGVGHSYMNKHDTFVFRRLAKHTPLHAQYDEAAAEDSWRRVFAFFEKVLTGKEAVELR